MTDQGEPILPFEISRDTEEGPSLTWKLLHTQGPTQGLLV